MEKPRRTALLLLPLFLLAAATTNAQSPFFFDPFNVSFNNIPFFGGGVDGSTPSGGQSGNQGRSRSSTRDLPTDYTGDWEMVASPGVSAMHMIITHLNKAIIFDATNFGPSQMKLPSSQKCRFDTELNITDCTSHAFEFDLDTSEARPLRVETNPWCASGGMDKDGNLVQTGGYYNGGSMVRYLKACDTCDWEEHEDLAGRRWYATQQILPDASIIVIGGRRAFSYEFVPTPAGKPNKAVTKFQFLFETTNEVEDNLYPFVHLSTDGNLFIFANNRSILHDYKTNTIIREFPPLPDARNYPSSGMSALLPLNLNRKRSTIPAEVVVCGGAEALAMWKAKDQNFFPALQTCHRIDITKEGAAWKLEKMPKPRIMADLHILPNGDLLFVNGATKGSAGWLYARDPVFEPWLYKPWSARDQRFTVLKPTDIPRMYHSSSALLPDGKILVAGSNPNNGYKFKKVMYPTEFRIEKYSPPYLDSKLADYRPEITSTANKIKYDQNFKIEFKVSQKLEQPGDIKVTMYAPPFTTHGYSMGQRLLILKTLAFTQGGNGGGYQISVSSPATSVLAPPGYYLVFVVNRGVPSKGAWVQIQ